MAVLKLTRRKEMGKIMLEYVFIVLLLVWAVWYLCRRLGNSCRGSDCGCACGGCPLDSGKKSCSVDGQKEEERELTTGPPA
ncbi:MAG: hypothetical protein LBH14_09595 [Desulfobulbaceae bacterium]|nr:hypothetical protein [Desulfobulbaceae bacterium]